MNNKTDFIINNPSNEYLLEIINLHTTSTSISDYVVSLKSIIEKMNIPLFNISCLSNIDGSDHLFIHPDWEMMQSWIPDIQLSNNLPFSSTLNIKKIISNKTIFKNSILFATLKGYIAISNNLSIPQKYRSSVVTYSLQQLLHDFLLTNQELYQIISPQVQEKILQSPLFGGILSFPLFSDKDIIGSFDIVFPKNNLIINEQEFSAIELISKLVATGLKQFRYHNKIVFSETKYNSLLNAIPMGMFVINSDYTIIESNKTFNNWFHAKHPYNKKCYEIIFSRNFPCNDCPSLRVINNASSVIRETKIDLSNSTLYFKHTASPIITSSGKVSSVVNILEDITSRIIAEQKVEKFSLTLADEVDKQTRKLREKQEKLELITNTLYSLKQAHTIKESIHYIINSLNHFGSHHCLVALLSSDVNTIQFIEIYPDSLYSLFQSISKQDILNTKLKFSKYGHIPFFSVIKTGKNYIIDNLDDLKNMIENTFDSIDEDKKDLLINEFKDKLIIFYPIGTEHRIEGSIAIALDKSFQDENNDYIELLLNAAAVEINRKRNQEDLIKSELKYRNLVENTQDIILLCTSEGEIIYANNVFYKTIGLNDSQTTYFFDFINENEKHLLHTIMKHSLQSGTNPQPFEVQLYNVSGHPTWYELAMSLVPLDNAIGIQIVARDIERKKRMEAHIQNLTEFQEKILQNEMIGIITTDLSGIITSWNKGASIILGYQPFEILNTPMSKLIYSLGNTHSIQTSFNQHIFINQPYDEITMLKKSGESLTTLCMSSLLHDDHDIPFARLFFFIDITEKKRLEEESLELNQRLHHAQIVTIVSLAKLAEYRHKETGMHLERIMRYVEVLANELSRYPDYIDYITNEYIRDIVNSCLLHDIGKVGIPDHILLKPGKLTEYEFEIMKQHTIIGAETIAEAERKVSGRSYLNLGKEIAYYHHERWDGSGYPKGLKGMDIPLSARIVAVADVYDALVSERPYKRAYPHEKAVKIISDQAGTYFDPVVVTAFLNNHNKFLEIKNTLL